MQINITLIFIELMSDILFILMCDTENLHFSNIFYSSGFNVESREREREAVIFWFVRRAAAGSEDDGNLSHVADDGLFFCVGSSAAVTDAPLLFSVMLLLSITYFFASQTKKKW